MRSLVLLSVLAGLQADPGQVEYPRPDPFTQIITAEMIRNAGLVRPGEIFLLIDGWDYSTIDGLHEYARAPGAVPLKPNGWMLWIDGERIDMNLLDERSLNLLPLPLQDISYVEVKDLPQVHEGTYAGRGIIHIHTIRDEEGLSARGGLWAGNETGDAGPYRYLEGSTTDIEHNGPELSASFSGASKDGWGRLSAVTRNQPVTDDAIYRRNLSLSYEMPVVEMLAVGFTGHLDIGESSHNLTAGLSDTEDFHFFHLEGRELPSDTRFGWAGINGSFPARSGGRHIYRISYTSNHLTDWPNKRDMDFDRRLDFIRANLELQEEKGTYQQGIGISAETVHSRHRDYLYGGSRQFRDDFTRVLVYGYLRGIGTEKLEQDVDFHATNTKGGIAIGGAVRTRWRMNDRNTLAASVTLAERLLEDDHGYWYRTGATPMQFIDNPYSRRSTGEFENSYMRTADLMWRSRPVPDLTVDVRIYYRHFQDLALGRSYLSYIPQIDSYEGSTMLLGGFKGEVSGCLVSAGFSPLQRVSLRFWMDERLTASGDGLFREKWEPIPSRQLRMIVNYIPVPALSLTAIADFRSFTTWPEYSGAVEETGGSYSGTIPGMWNVDIIAGKWFWNNRLRGTILARNLFNRRYRYHPVGAAFDLSLLARFELYIGN